MIGLFHETPWMAEAACSGKDQTPFFPERGEQWATRAAKQVCAGCPVKADCLDYALRNRIEHGVWGGCSTKERIAIKRRQAREARIEREARQW